MNVWLNAKRIKTSARGNVGRRVTPETKQNVNENARKNTQNVTRIVWMLIRDFSVPLVLYVEHQFRLNVFCYFVVHILF